MNLFNRLRGKPQDAPDKPVIVVFAGGMGTQILQAATYLALKNNGRSVWADLSYFDTQARMAQEGEKGKATHWFWQLDQYGLSRDRFETATSNHVRGARLLRDGPEMMQRGLQALTMPEIRQFFQPADAGSFDLAQVTSQPFLCIHVRRGDYVNVASHLVSDSEFLEMGRKFSGLIDNAVLLSDSPFTEEFKTRMDQLFGSVSYLDRLDPYASHWLMRQARILVCSNSTYSLTAAMLNPEALVVMPKHWFGENDRAIEAPIQDLCRFQIMR